jgi:hypothetical protein
MRATEDKTSFLRKMQTHVYGYACLYFNVLRTARHPETGHMRKLREIWVTRQNFSLRRYTTLRTGRRMNRVSNNLAFYLNRLYKLAIIMRRMGNKYKATYSSVFEKVSLFTIMICIRFEKCFKEILFSKPFLGRSRSKESTVHYEIHSSKNVSKKL